MTTASARCPYPLEIQSFIFAKSEFDLPDAFEWLEKNKVRRAPVEMLETGQSYRARMHQPTEFVEGSFRTIRLGRGESRVQAVVGCPKKHVRAAIVSERSARQASKAAGKKPAPVSFARVSVRAAPRSEPVLVAKRLAASPPSPGMSFREWARREGVAPSPAAKRAWKDRRR